VSVRSARSTRVLVACLAACLGAAGAAPIASAATRAASPSDLPHGALTLGVASLSVSTVNQDESIPATVHGSGFTSGAKVNLGKGVVVSVQSVTATSISVHLRVAHDAAVGARTLTVTDPGGATGSRSKALHVDYAPVFVKWAVGEGAVNWQTSLVRPQFFVAPKLSFSGSGVSVTGESLGSGGRLAVGFSIASGAAAGWRTMTIVEGPATWTVSDGLKVRLPPVVRSVGPLGQGATNQTVPIYGSNFEVCKSKEPGVAIDGTGVSVDSVSAALGNLMYAKLTVAANAALGPRDVTVTNCDSGGVSTTASAFRVVGLPSVTSMPPIAVGVQRRETLTGTNLTWGTTFSVPGGGVAFTAVKWLSPTKVRAMVWVDAAATIGAHDVTASDKGGGSTTSTGVLSVDALPTATSDAPSGIGANTAVVLTVNGTGFEKGAHVRIGPAGSTSTDAALRLGPAVVDSSTKLQVVVAARATTTLAAVVVTVSNPDGGVVTGLHFTTDPSPVLKVASSVTTAGALGVTFTRPSGAPATEAYDLEACTNAAMSARCVHANGFKSGHTLAGLVAGDKYYVVITALTNGSYFSSRSAVVGPHLASVRLRAPSITKLTATSSTLHVSFLGASNGPRSQTYTARACRNLAMTTGCVTHAHYRSGTTFTGVGKAKYFVRIFAVASSGYLASESKIVAT
jgi:hypothetical protein